MHLTIFRLNGVLLCLFMMCLWSPVVFTPNSKIQQGKTKQKGAPAQGQSIPGNVPAHPIGQSYNERAMEMSRAIYWNTVQQV